MWGRIVAPWPFVQGIWQSQTLCAPPTEGLLTPLLPLLVAKDRRWAPLREGGGGPICWAGPPTPTQTQR